MALEKKYNSSFDISLVLAFYLIIGFASVYAQQVALPPSLQGNIPLDPEALLKIPEFRWENKKDSVWSLYYQGEVFYGKQAEVFAYYASPSTLSRKKSKGTQYPAVVLVHGGGGTAFAVWVRYWAKKGFAAIAMDLGGAKPLPEKEQQTPWSTKSEPLPNGAPDDTDVYKFFSIDKDFSRQWQFHAVSNIIRAHSLIRSFSEADSSRTALTGISWGGYLTNLAAGVDHRFKAAVPVYGCGFLHEKSTWLSRFDSLGYEKANKWVQLWDPSSYVRNASMPMLFINGTNDFAYHVESWQKTIDLVRNSRQLLIHEMLHNHETGADSKEIVAFINEVFKDAKDISVMGRTKKVGKWYEAAIIPGTEIIEANFVFTSESKENKERKWQKVPATIKEGRLVAEGGHKIKAAFFLITDEEGNQTSSPVFFN